MTTVILIIVAWLVLAAIVGLLFGRAIHHADTPRNARDQRGKGDRVRGGIQHHGKGN